MSIKQQIPEHIEARILATVLELALNRDDLRAVFPMENRVLLWDLRDKWQNRAEQVPADPRVEGSE